MSALPEKAALDRAHGRLFGTVQEVADILEVDPRTVRHGIAAGTIPSVRVSGNTVRIPWAPFLRDVCGLDQTALAALELPGYSPTPTTPGTQSAAAKTIRLAKGHVERKSA